MVQVNQRMLEWADLVFVMDGEQVEALGKMFPDHPRLPQVICLNIMDTYHFNDPELIALLQERTRPYFDKLKTATS
jgi:protein-tyrosine phosphatase